ncbi:hypothetical protein BDQ12DRAFT_520950 [Crucibulum laeve]|uniref:Uncharacterized protein n=1 Tax=Crucibulum laeve TaxID=68775 RepID=A0A5C3M453_9AGAR|nr:hypothetical protein BDQ12DRAFT_520950 [Crucibulum laeve]
MSNIEMQANAPESSQTHHFRPRPAAGRASDDILSTMGQGSWRLCLDSDGLPKSYGMYRSISGEQLQKLYKDYPRKGRINVTQARGNWYHITPGDAVDINDFVTNLAKDALIGGIPTRKDYVYLEQHLPVGERREGNMDETTAIKSDVVDRDEHDHCNVC